MVRRHILIQLYHGVCFISSFHSLKLFRRTKFIRPIDADLRTGLEEIERHEYEYYEQLEQSSNKPDNKFKSILHWIF